MATSRACYGAGAATRICTTCCSRPSVWRLPGRNSWLSGMQPKMPTPTNSRAEPFNFHLGGSHGAADNEEQPLYRVQPTQGYIHYNKGSLVMYALQDYIGEDKVNHALSEFVKAYA